MSDLNFYAEIAISVLLIIGAFFILVGSIGLIKLNNSMSRLHAPTKASTLGVGSILVASVTFGFFGGDGSLHEMLVMALLFVSAPITAHFIAKVNLHRLRGKPDLPPPTDEHVWGTYSDK